MTQATFRRLAMRDSGVECCYSQACIDPLANSAPRLRNDQYNVHEARDDGDVGHVGTPLVGLDLR
jgi:hypothetical protein